MCGMLLSGPFNQGQGHTSINVCQSGGVAILVAFTLSLIFLYLATTEKRLTTLNRIVYNAYYMCSVYHYELFPL